MNCSRVLFAAAALTLGFVVPALAQQASAPAAPSNSTPEKTTNPIDSEMDRKLQDLIHSQHGQNPAQGEDKMKAEADALNDSQATANALQLSCDIVDVRLVSAGREMVDGKPVPAKAYEVACNNGMGYFLVSHSPQAPTGFSCFAADAQRQALEAKGQKFDDICTLKANRNLTAAATKILKNAGTACAVTKLAWFGQSTASKMEYNEVACSDGKGYILGTTLPGTPLQMSLIGCPEGAARGMKCQLTTVAAVASNDADPVPTADNLKAALAAHGPACTVTDMRVVGRETVRKRHVVEFLCPEQPKGLVAFIPLGANPNKYQAVDCPTAAKAGVICKLTSAK